MAGKSRAANGEGTKPVLRPDGRWWSRVTYYDEDGARKRKDIYGRTSAECVRKKRDFFADLDAGITEKSKDQTVEQYLTDWLENVVKPNVRFITYENYKRDCRLHIIPSLGTRKLQELTRSHVQNLVSKLQRKGLSNYTVIGIMGVLRIALRHAHETAAIKNSVTDYLKLPKRDSAPVRHLTPEEARAILTAVKGNRLEAMFVAALALGLRRGEVLGLQWEDIDFEKNVVFIRRSRYTVARTGVVSPPKTAAAKRTIHMPEIAATYLRSHRVRQYEERLSKGENWDTSTTPYVFTNQKGQPLSASTFQYWVKKLVKLAGTSDIHIHGLRHTAVSLLVAQKVDIKLITEIVGHSNVTTTLNIYAHLFASQRKEGAQAMNDILSEQPDGQKKGEGDGKGARESA